MRGTRRAQRRIRGGASVALLVWVVMFLGAYGAWKLMGVSSVEGTIERAVVEVFGKVDLDTSHDAIKHNIVRGVAVASIELDPENIRVETERRPGELVVAVAVEHPVPVSFLGYETVLTADVDATRSIPVDEVALARHKRHRERLDEHWEEVRDAMDECREKWGRGNCQLTERPGTELEVIRDF